MNQAALYAGTRGGKEASSQSYSSVQDGGYGNTQEKKNARPSGNTFVGI